MLSDVNEENVDDEGKQASCLIQSTINAPSRVPLSSSSSSSAQLPHSFPTAVVEPERHLDELRAKEELIDQHLKRNPNFAKAWFLQNVSVDLLNQWLNESEKKGIDFSFPSQEADEVMSSFETIKEDADDADDADDDGDGNGEEQEDEENFLKTDFGTRAEHGRNSITTELFQDIVEGCSRRKKSANLSQGDRMSRDEKQDYFKELNEQDLFMELIKDVANELDMDLLCHKILVNVSILTKSDRGSLFLARGRRDSRFLVAKLFDVTPNSLLAETLSAAEQLSRLPPIPFGVGIAGHVASTKETVNIKNAYEDSRFNKAIDSKTGYRTVSLMCLPILNYNGDVIGVAQCVNKQGGDGQFTKEDEQVFKKYLIFCGIGIQNAQLFEMSIQESKRNEKLLSLARSIFEETTSLENLIKKIMMNAQGLLQSERCRVYLIDTESEHFQNTHFLLQHNEEPPIGSCIDPCTKSLTFSSVFDLETRRKEIVKLSSKDINENDIYARFARHVAATQQTYNWSSTNSVASNESSDVKMHVGNILSIPVVVAENKVIGVAQLINRTASKPFTDADVTTLEAFAIFCGLGIHNAQMYDKAIKLMAKQKVALEVLSYHASSTLEEANRLMMKTVLTAEEYRLHDFDFIDFNLSDDDTCLATLRMFLDMGLISRFHIPYPVLCRWVLSVKKNYRPVIYHNWRHSINVTQTMFAMLTTGKVAAVMTELEHLALIVACLCHDLDHRGTNNSFQTKTASPLATLYGTSTMEHHHFDQCIMILNSEGNNILQFLSPEEYKFAVNVIESAILSTDLAQYDKKKDSFFDLVSSGEKEWKDLWKRDVLRGMLMTACDVSATTKPWEVQKKIAELVAGEFFEQGDLEREKLKETPDAMMDRQKKGLLPKMQVIFIDSTCEPVYRVGILYLLCSFKHTRWLCSMGFVSRSREDHQLS